MNDNRRERGGEGSRLGRLAARLDALNEYERSPVAPDKLRGGRYFAAIYGGEHVAGTEFVIGSMFVLGGVSARDLFLGLIVGNVLAVLSWTLICAPIAVRVRLTLYWYLRRIAGPGLGVIYSIANAVLFCFLAGAMIALCADAISTGLEKVGLAFTRPSLNDTYPSSVGWVILVLLSGGVVTTIAILGFEKMAKFASVCVPWMFLIFVAAALAVLARPEMGMQGIGDFWRVANEKIWTGQPVAGRPQLGFWHVASFAWFCNLCTHIDLSDMAIFRYARHWGYGLYSAIGMFLGHFLAWICSGIISAPFRDLIIATNNQDPSLSIGNMAFGAAGLAGLLCVLFASWSTANPTLYRAGLALQIATPNWPRWRVTLAAGILTSLAACFPVFVMQLLGFVAIFGLVLMPIGAVVFAEHWLFPRLGLAQYWTERRGLVLNPAALITWAVSLLFCFLVLERILGVDLFFLWLPGYILALALYPLLAAFLGARGLANRGTDAARVAAANALPSTAPAPTSATGETPGGEVPAPRGRPGDETPARPAFPPWRVAAGLVAVASLAAILATAVARVAGAVEAETFQLWINGATVGWLLSAPFWLTPGLFGLDRPAAETSGGRR